MSEQHPQRIVILGGGFGGLYTALRLCALPWEDGPRPEITLVDRGDRFLFSPLLYELITDELQTWEIAPYFQDLLEDTWVRFQQDEVTTVDVAAQRVMVKSGHHLDYDYLVWALGGETAQVDVEGIKDHGYPFRSLQDAYGVKAKLRALESQDPEKIRVAVVGGGYSGVELATKISDRLGSIGRVRIIDRSDTLLKSAPKGNQEAALKALEERKIWLDLETEVLKLTADEITLNYQGQEDVLPVDLVLWTVGNRSLALHQQLPLPQDERGYLRVNSCLQVVDHPHIFALGDGITGEDAQGQPIPATAQAAIQAADYCGWNLWATIGDRPLLPFRYENLGEAMALGKDNAALSAFGLAIEGPLAYGMRRLAYLYRLPTRKHQLAVGLNWITQPLAELFKF